MFGNQDWQSVKDHFDAWWRGGSLGRPMMRVVARRESPTEPLEPEAPCPTYEDLHIGLDRAMARQRNFLRGHELLGEAFSALDMNIGPGSLAVYLGSEPVFMPDTVWYEPCIEDWDAFGPLRHDRDNAWWKKHLALIQEAASRSEGAWRVNIPDLIENLDILAAMRGPQRLCLDLMDDPGRVQASLDRLDELYFIYYDALYNAVKDADGGSSYTCFSIWGGGRTAKLQCDFSALMSPAHFRRFVLPSLDRQSRRLDHVLYHLDGPDAIRHLDALMELPGIGALQYVPSPMTPDGSKPAWYPIYDKVRAAGKSLWILFGQDGPDEWMARGDRLVSRYGPDGLYFLFPVMARRDAERLMEKAERDWR